MSQSETDVIRDIRADYGYGWHVEDKPIYKAPKGLSHELIDVISDHKAEPDWMRRFRHESLDYFFARPMPGWGADLSGIDFDNIHYYLRPTEKRAEKAWDEARPKLEKALKQTEKRADKARKEAKKRAAVPEKPETAGVAAGEAPFYIPATATTSRPRRKGRATARSRSATSPPRRRWARTDPDLGGDAGRPLRHQRHPA